MPRRLGGAHRRKKRTVAAVYGIRGLRTIEDVLSALETVTIETYALENSVGRNRAIAGMLKTVGELIETNELEERIRSLEDARSTDREERDPFGDAA